MLRFDALGMGPAGRFVSAVGMILALVLVTVGLLASTFHLGHPERAIGAFSQWRSSWLSREGVAAVGAYAPSGLLALLWLFGVRLDVEPVLAALAAIGAVGTVYCTGMIYASLRAIRQWHLSLTPSVYLALAAMTGALLLGALVTAFGDPGRWAAGLGLGVIAIAAALKALYWSQIDSDPGRYTAEMAIGLGRFGDVRPLDPPHTRPNFVMREMGYVVARKHALALRRIVWLTLFAGPAVLMLLAMAAGWGAPFLFALAVVSAGVGVVLERWLFFAEAEHVSQLYYGAARA